MASTIPLHWDEMCREKGYIFFLSEFSFGRDVAAALVTILTLGVWCPQKLLLVRAAAAATCLHTCRLGTTEPRA